MSGNSYASKKRSLLGFDDPDAEAMVKQTQEQIATQNEAKVRRALLCLGFLPLFLNVAFCRLASCWKGLDS